MASPPESALDELPVLDPDRLRNLLEIGAEPSLIHELIAIFREDVPIRLAAIQAALRSSARETLHVEAHQLKGALGNMGLLRFADQARQIETLAGQGRLDLVPPLVAALPAASAEALEALAQAFPQD